MKYYVGDKQINVNRIKDYVSEGVETVVYKNGNYVLKIFKSKFAVDNFADKSFRLQLSKIDTKRIVMPKDMIFKCVKNDSLLHYVGYTSSYIKPNELSIRLIDTRKLLEDFILIMKDIEILNKRNIIANDVHKDNIIFDNNFNMFIVDTGSFNEAFFKKTVRTFNKRAINYMLKSLIVDTSLIVDGNVKKEMKDYLSDKLDYTDALNFIEREMCQFDNLDSYQKSLKRKIIRYM